MKKLLLSMLMCVMALGAAAQAIKGDVNCDGTVNISDVSSLIDYLLGDRSQTFDADNADTDLNGIVDIADVSSLIDYLLNGIWPWNEPQDNHEWVDLGLPSGTLWATCNVGANAPEEYGDYFAWGETEPKDTCNWSTYKWCNGSSNTLTKYCTKSAYGILDNKDILEPKDDAAYVNWGKKWRMPTYDQMLELKNKCTWRWTTQNGVKGRLVKGPNGASLFLPAAGSREDGSLSYASTYGDYWTRTIYSDIPYYACNVDFNSSNVQCVNTYFSRCYGLTVRAVRISQN